MEKLAILLCFAFLPIRFLSAQTQVTPLFNELIQTAAETNSDALLVYQNGRLVIEEYFEKTYQDSLIETMSCTKSIVALAFMAMWEDGIIDSLSFPVWQIYPEWKQGRKKDITIYHLLSMTSGIQNVPNASLEIYPSPDFVQLALCAEIEEDPGATFRYNNKAINLLSGIAKRLTGKRLDQYIEQRLFKPLGIHQYQWALDEAGHPQVMAGCQLRPEDFAKIGLLVLNQGQYEGQQVLSPSSIQKMLTPLEHYPRYGLLWWCMYKKEDQGNNQTINRDTSKQKDQPIAYNANGYLGNYLVIVPATQTVAVRMMSHQSYNWEAERSNSFPSFREMIIRLH